MEQSRVCVMAHMLKLVYLQLARWSLTAHKESIWKLSEGQHILKPLGVMRIVMSFLTVSSVNQNWETLLDIMCETCRP